MSADRPVLLYAHPSMDGLAKAIVASCDEVKTNSSALQQVCYKFLSSKAHSAPCCCPADFMLCCL